MVPDEAGERRILIVIAPSHAYLADLMAAAFEGLAGVEVLVDRRRGERRRRAVPVTAERRRRARRRAGEDIGEIVITGGPPTPS